MSNNITDNLQLINEKLNIVLNLTNQILNEYEEVNALYTTNQAYIDTGIIGDSNKKIECKVRKKIGSTAYANPFLGAWSGTSGFLMSEINSDRWRCHIGSGDAGSYEVSMAYVSSYPYVTIILSSKQIKCIDASNNNQLYSSTIDRTFNTNLNMYLFSRNNYGSSDGGSGNSHIIYYCKIWDNDILVRNFIPVKRIADGVYGMLDKVNNVFYTTMKSNSTFTEYKD